MKHSLLIPAVICLAIAPAHAISLYGRSATQIAVSYTAPTTSACTVKVSTNSSYVPLAHDVDTTLFSGSNSDFRAGSVVSGVSRIFVAGKRTTELASNATNYSRALQAYTTHYFEVTCGTTVYTNAFQTENIPQGMTWNDIPEVEVSTPGSWRVPTLFQDMSQEIIDPQTGALIRRISLDNQCALGSNSEGMFAAFGGFNRMCASEVKTAPDGAQGYLCTMFQWNQGFGYLYFIIPATGEVRNLGNLPFGFPRLDNNLQIYDTDGTTVSRYTYTGNYVPAGPYGSGSYTAPLDGPNLYSPFTLPQMMHNFDVTFDTSIFTGCSILDASASKYTLLQCLRHGQDSYGWAGILYRGDGRNIPATPCDPADTECPRIIAAMYVLTAPETRYCTSHNYQLIESYPILSENFQEMRVFGNQPDGTIGLAPMATTLVNGISASSTTIIVSSAPMSLATDGSGVFVGDPIFQDAQAGDIFYIGPNKEETITINSVTMGTGSQRIWTIMRTSHQVFPAGTVVWAACKANFKIAYWKFLEDPHGTDATNTKVIVDQFFDGGGHWDSGSLGRISEGGFGGSAGWSIVKGPLVENLNQPYTAGYTDSPDFAGVHGSGFGSTTSKHPSYHQLASQTSTLEQKWFSDMTPFDGSNIISDDPGAILISGSLYRYVFYPPSPNLYRKQLPTFGSSGDRSLRDISGPGSVIYDDSRSAFTYCVANLANECVSGSSPGDTFANVPDLVYNRCTGGDGPNYQNKDLCIGPNSGYAQAVEQIYIGDTNQEGTKYARILSHGLAGIKHMLYFSTGKPLPDASWMMFPIGVGNSTEFVHMFMAKIPPFQDPATSLNINRETFIRSTVTITSPQGIGVTNAVVKFGYAEYGSTTSFYCTTRQEACVSISSTGIDDTDPFRFAVTESTPGISCASNCQAVIPLLPQHVAYYQVLYRDSSNATVSTGPLSIAMEPDDPPTPPTPSVGNQYSTQISGQINIRGGVIFR